MKTKIVMLFSIIMVLIKPSPASACDFCALHIGATPFEFNRNSIRIDTRVASGREVFIDGAKAPNPKGLDGRFITTQLTGFYQLTDRLILSAVVPWVDRREKHLEADGSVEQFHTRGLGDITLLGNYVFFNNAESNPDNSTKFAGTIGLKFPTGDTNQATNGEVAEMHLQPGTGSWDLLIGGSAARRMGRFSLYADILFKFNTDGANDYRFGNSFLYNIVGKYQVWPGNTISSDRVFLLLGLNEEISKQDKESGVAVEDTGGDMLMVSPGINIFLKARWLIEAIYQRPVQRRFNGTDDHPQVVTSDKFIVGVQYFFL